MGLVSLHDRRVIVSSEEGLRFEEGCPETAPSIRAPGCWRCQGCVGTSLPDLQSCFQPALQGVKCWLLLRLRHCLVPTEAEWVRAVRVVLTMSSQDAGWRGGGAGTAVWSKGLAVVGRVEQMGKNTYKDFRKKNLFEWVD